MIRRSISELMHRLLQGTGYDTKEVLWLVLVGIFVLCSLHLITLFATRWGERRVTGKALILSLMLHFAFAVGLITLAPVAGIPQGGGTDNEPEHRVLIRGVSANTDREARDDSAGAASMAIWDKVPAPDKKKPLTPAPQLPLAGSLPSVPRIAEAIKNATRQPLPELASLPEIAHPKPAPKTEQISPTHRAAATPAIETPVASSVKRVESPLPPLAAPPGTSIPTSDSSVQRQVSPPGHPQPQGNLQPGALADATNKASSLPQLDAPKPTVTRGAADEPIHRKTAPTRTAEQPDMPAGNGKPVKTAASPALPKLGAAPSGTSGWQATVQRLKTADSGSTPGAAGSASSKGSPSTTPGDYQSSDSGPPSPLPQISDTGGAPLIVRRKAGVPLTYRLRKISNRKENARAYGGTDQSERAVETSLSWLAKVQEPRGYWSAKAFGAGQVKIDEGGVDRDYAGRDADSGVTALAVLAFLGAGYTHEEGQYSDTVDRALRWLIAQQQSDGNLGQGAGHFAMMYCHGIATYAIAEAYGMQNDPTSNTMLREPLLRAVTYILDNQNPDGGWRYLKGQKSDVSMFGWQLMGLKSAEIAGVTIPHDAKVRMVSFLKERSLGDRAGLAGYRDGESATPSMTAEALFCKQMLGISRENASSQEAAEYLLVHLPRRAEFNEYYWYYGTLAMYQYGGEGWQTWNQTVRELLVAEQRNTGDLAGSWDPVGPWARYGGRIYSTALSTLCLEVYYRFLPLYQMGHATKD